MLQIAASPLESEKSARYNEIQKQQLKLSSNMFSSHAVVYLLFLPHPTSA